MIELIDLNNDRGKPYQCHFENDDESHQYSAEQMCQKFRILSRPDADVTKLSAITDVEHQIHQGCQVNHLLRGAAVVELIDDLNERGKPYQCHFGSDGSSHQYSAEQMCQKFQIVSKLVTEAPASVVPQPKQRALDRGVSRVPILDAAHQLYVGCELWHPEHGPGVLALFEKTNCCTCHGLRMKPYHARHQPYHVSFSTSRDTRQYSVEEISAQFWLMLETEKTRPLPSQVPNLRRVVIRDDAVAKQEESPDEILPPGDLQASFSFRSYRFATFRDSLGRSKSVTQSCLSKLGKSLARVPMPACLHRERRPQVLQRSINSLRQQCRSIVDNEFFQNFIMLTILISCGFLAAETPQSQGAAAFYYGDICFIVIFTIEMLIKVVAYGLIGVPQSQLGRPGGTLPYLYVHTCTRNHRFSCIIYEHCWLIYVFRMILSRKAGFGRRHGAVQAGQCQLAGPLRPADHVHSAA